MAVSARVVIAIHFSLRTFYIQFTSTFTLLCVFIDSSAMLLFTSDPFPEGSDAQLRLARGCGLAPHWGPKHQLT